MTPNEKTVKAGASPNKMTFFEHLEELRKRILLSFAAVFIAFTGCYFISGKLLDFLEAPLKQVLPQGSSIIGTGLAEAFVVRIFVAFVAAIILSCPFWLYQLWRFIAPGLYPSEKKFVIPFVLFSTIFFLSGVCFGYYFVFPVGFKFFLEEYAGAGVLAQIRISEYFSFTSKMLLAFGGCFEFPIFAFFLGRLGIINWRGMLKASRYAIVIIFLVAAVITPGPDVASQTLLAAPLLLLYVMSIAIVALTGKKTPKSSSNEDIEGADEKDSSR